MQVFDSPVITRVASAALAIARRVTYSNGKMAYAGASAVGIGVTMRPSFAADEDIPVRMNTSPGLATVEAADTFAEGVTVYCAADGKVASTGTVPYGTSFGPALVAGNTVLVMPFATAPAAPTGLPAVPAEAGDYQLTIAEGGTATWTEVTAPPSLPDAPAGAGDYELTVSAQGAASWTEQQHT